MVGFADAADAAAAAPDVSVEIIEPPAHSPRPIVKSAAPKKSALKKSSFNQKETTDATTGSNESGSNDGEAPTTVNKKARPKAARFGSVRVAWHRMTLGSAHPGGTEGVPVTLGELQGMERYSNVNKFSQKFHYVQDGSHEMKRKEKKKMERLTSSFRHNIALEGHTEEELEEVEKEVTELVGERKETSKEEERKNFLEYKRQQREAAEAKLKAEKQPGCCGGR